jgi:hemerythrin-like metal-binding protein
MSVFEGYGNSGGNDVDRMDLGASMRIGVDEVDKLHIELARLIESINEDPQALTSSESMTDLVWETQIILAKEFAIEEKLMLKNKVPESQFAEHVREHTALLALFVEISVDAMSHNPIKAQQLYQTIRTRFIEHTIKHDMRLS